MQLEPAQLEAVKKWLAEGASLSDVQKRLKEEFGVSMLYLDLRMLVLDIGASVKEAPKKAEPPANKASDRSDGSDRSDRSDGSDGSFDNADNADDADDFDDAEKNPRGMPGALPRIAVSLDRVVKPGALVSGEAVFPGGDKVHWILDRAGRLAIDQAPPGFAPSQEEALGFQQSLRETLMKNGYA